MMTQLYRTVMALRRMPLGSKATSLKTQRHCLQRETQSVKLALNEKLFVAVQSQTSRWLPPNRKGKSDRRWSQRHVFLVKRGTNMRRHVHARRRSA